MGTKSGKKKKTHRIDQIVAKVAVWGQLELLEILGETNTLRLT